MAIPRRNGLLSAQSIGHALAGVKRILRKYARPNPAMAIRPPGLLPRSVSGALQSR
jgi:hypothetical protein